MNEAQASKRRWKRVNVRSIKWPTFAVAALCGFFDHDLHGWGRTGFATGIGISVAIIGLREFWRERKFWVAVVGLMAVEALLAIAARPFLEQSGFGGLLVFGIANCAAMIFALSYICPVSSQ